MSKRTIAVDFDGVLHSYDSGWSGVDSIQDPPVPGAIDWLNDMVNHFDVVIHTTRALEPAGAVAVQMWIEEQGGPRLPVTAEKVKAIVYIDDRAWRFEGDRFPSAKELHEAKPWRKRENPDAVDPVET